MLPLSPDRMYLSSSFVWGALFSMMTTVSLIYMVDLAQLDPLQLVLVGTALEVSAFIFEVPTGVIADNYSRKLSVVLGFLVTGLSFVVMAAVPEFWWIAAGSFIWGFGWTLISGAHQAWLADEAGVSEAGALYLKGQKVSSYGSFVGIAIAVPVALVQINYPILLSGALFVAWSIFAWFGMQERNFNPQPSDEGYGQLFQTLADGVNIVRGSGVLILLMVVGVIFGTFSEGYDRLSTAHLLRDFDFPAPFGAEPVILFAIITVIGNLLSIWLVTVVERKVDTDNSRQIAVALSWMCACIVIAVLIFAASGFVWLAILMYLLLIPLRRIFEPLTVAWMNQHIESRVRATVISLHSQSDALGQMAGGPGVGLIGREFGVRVALTVSGVLLIPAVWLYRRHRGEGQAPSHQNRQ